MVLSHDSVVQKMSADIYQAKHMWKVLRALGGFAILLKQAIRKREIRHRPTSANSTPVIPFPSARDIAVLPLQNCDPLPSPFDMIACSGDSQPLDWMTWLNQYTSRLLSPAFMIEGEWCGYYSTGSAQNVSFDPPMVKIKFELTREDDIIRPWSVIRRDPNSIPISGTGVDGVGWFTLLGNVRGNKEIFCIKQYATHQWIWKCTMTPFGIFGNWYSYGQDQRVLGAVWLWKRNWKPFHLDTDARQSAV